MSAASLTTARRPVLADLLPGAAVRDAALIVTVAALTALAAQLRIPLPGSPVPITGQTFAVLLGAAALGPLRGSAAQMLYLALGAIGLPIFTGGESGVAYAFGATGGYLVGFVVASLVVGALARGGADRRVLGAVGALLAGTIVIYVLGVPWLIVATGMPVTAALWNGAAVFVLGDVVKALAAGALLPAAWRLAERD